MIEWIATGLVILVAIVLAFRRSRKGEEYTASGPVTISGSGDFSVVDKVRKFKDRCLGAFR